jgi:hypothetical protein
MLSNVRAYGSPLKDVPKVFQADREIVLAACRQDGRGLEHACTELKADKEIVLVTVQEKGWAPEYASAELQADKEVVLVAASSYPDALKYAKGGLGQDKECLVAAKVWDRSYKPSSPSVSKIVRSTRFSLEANSRSQATRRFAVLLNENDYIQKGNFSVYSPNAFGKDTCDPEWTDFSWPCRGTFDTCRNEEALKRGVPQTASCWRYSFRYQLEEAKRTDGCMIQLVECVGGRYSTMSWEGSRH